MESQSKPDPLEILSKIIMLHLQNSNSKAASTDIIEIKNYIDYEHQNLLTVTLSNPNQSELLDTLLEIYKFIFLSAINDDSECNHLIKVLLEVLRKHPKTSKAAISEIIKYATKKDFSNELIKKCINISEKHEVTQCGSSLYITTKVGPSGVRIDRNKNTKLLSDTDGSISLKKKLSLRINSEIIFSCENKEYYIMQESIESIESSAMIQCENSILRNGDCFSYLQTHICVENAGDNLILQIKKENEEEVERLVLSDSGTIGGHISANYKDSQLRPKQIDLIKDDENWIIKNTYVDITFFKYLHNASDFNRESEKFKIDAPKRLLKVEDYEFELLQESDTK
ncbi:hypothetical protein SteCoe_4098 [Stentor coeruleus]|uniref:Uncharacterized protein n=1 Tax=Stentor coeruleus TaxID=5963 RepID=A0A1R2CVI2_9CILI|nr:hypothetical protein SteCoe_4098 [Stentor coeruleus]